MRDTSRRRRRRQRGNSLFLRLDLSITFGKKYYNIGIATDNIGVCMYDRKKGFIVFIVKTTSIVIIYVHHAYILILGYYQFRT